MFDKDGRKKEFINYVISVTLSDNDVKEIETIWINTFNRLEKIEVELGKDFSYFNIREIKKYLPQILVRTFKYQNQQISLLRKYLNWCIENNLTSDKENKLEGLIVRDIDFSRHYNEFMIKDEEQLANYLDGILSSIDEKGADNMYRLLLHLIFNGFEFEEVWNLKLNQVDYNKKCIHCINEDVFISDMCLNLISEISKIDVIITKNNCKKPINKEGYLLENSSTNRKKMDKTARVTISNMLKTLKNKLNYSVALTFSSIYQSGVFYRMYRYENLNDGVNASEIDMSNNTRIEYEAWKKTFHNY